MKVYIMKLDLDFNEFFKETLSEQKLLPSQASERSEIDAVIEEHRQLVGAEKVHLSLGPDANAENIRSSLEEIRNKTKQYHEFSELEQEKAKVARLRARLSRICKLGQTDYRKFSEQHEDVTKLKREIFNLTDLIADIDLEKDTEWMKLNRENWKKAYFEEYKIFEE